MVLLLPSVTVNVTDVTPNGKEAPAKGDCVTELTVQLSETEAVLTAEIATVKCVSSHPASNFGSITKSSISPGTIVVD